MEIQIMKEYHQNRSIQKISHPGGSMFTLSCISIKGNLFRQFADLPKLLLLKPFQSNNCFIPFKSYFFQDFPVPDEAVMSKHPVFYRLPDRTPRLPIVGTVGKTTPYRILLDIIKSLCDALFRSPDPDLPKSGCVDQ